MDDWKSNLSLLGTMDKGQIREHLMRYAHAGDNASALAFLNGMREYVSKKNIYALRSMCLGALLFEDCLDTAQVCFQTKDIDAWCNNNVEHLIDKAPKVFAYWATPQNFASVAQELQYTLGDETRLAILSGSSQIPQHQRIHALLKEQPFLWALMPIDWVGYESTPLRQKAQELGWTHSMLFEVVHRYDWDYDISRWSTVTSYPYSLCTAAVLCDLEKANRHTEQEALMLERIVRIGLELSIDTHANPMDAALTYLLLQCTLELKRSLSSTVDRVRFFWENASEYDKDILQGLVNMHSTLGTMSLLVDALGHGVLEHQQTMEAMPLPNVNGTTEMDHAAQY